MQCVIIASNQNVCNTIISNSLCLRWQAKKADHMNYITRFLDTEGKVMMSTLLHYDHGAYESDTVSGWIGGSAILKRDLSTTFSDNDASHHRDH
jgi:hypothetical protein